MVRIFLAIVGAAYLILAGWCALMPDKTSRAVGFTLQTGSGQSEFLTVYGGLQFALGMAFLWPMFRPSEVALPLLLCLLIHGWRQSLCGSGSQSKKSSGRPIAEHRRMPHSDHRTVPQRLFQVQPTLRRRSSQSCQFSDRERSSAPWGLCQSHQRRRRTCGRSDNKDLIVEPPSNQVCVSFSCGDLKK